MLNPGRILLRGLAGTVATPETQMFDECIPPTATGPHAAYIPNILVVTHQGQTARFYELIQQRIVLVNCVAARNEASGSSLDSLAKAQSLIGEELGRRIFIYSITTEPEHDTPASLRGLAEKYGARDGWLFLTGNPAGLRILRRRLFTYAGGQDCSMHLIRYGNEAAGIWGGVMAPAKPEMLVQRLSWITPGEAPSGSPKRGGPPPLPEALAALEKGRAEAIRRQDDLA